MAEAEKAQTLKQRLELVERELGWALVEGKYKELELKIRDVAKIERDISKVNASLETDRVCCAHVV